VRWLFAALLILVVGCAKGPLVLQGEVDKYQKEQVALSRQKDEFQKRASDLDRYNQELTTKYTEEKQRTRLLEEQIGTLQQQMTVNNAAVAKLRDEKKNTEQKLQAVTVSLQRSGGAPIIPNNSVRQSLPAINLPEVYVRRDGDVVRVELPAHRLFQADNAILVQGADQVILAAASELLRSYPNHVVGVEGHTNTDPIQNPRWRDHHQLSVWRGTAVYDVLIAQGRVAPAQLFIVGHGANNPVLSNATPTGRQRNARVELVVYPDTLPGT
jgi:chemotaxis protein MotB